MSIIIEFSLVFILYKIFFFILDFIYFLRLCWVIDSLLKIISKSFLSGLGNGKDMFDNFNFLNDKISIISCISKDIHTKNIIEYIISIDKINILREEVIDYLMSKSEKRNFAINDILN